MLKKVIFTAILTLIFLPFAQAQEGPKGPHQNPGQHSPKAVHRAQNGPQGPSAGINQGSPEAKREHMAQKAHKPDRQNPGLNKERLEKAEHHPERRPDLRPEHMDKAGKPPLPRDGRMHAAEKRAEQIERFQENHSDAGKALEHRQERLEEFMARHPGMSREEAIRAMKNRHKPHRPMPQGEQAMGESLEQGDDAQDGMRPPRPGMEKRRELMEKHPDMEPADLRKARHHKQKMERLEQFKENHPNAHPGQVRQAAERKEQMHKAHKFKEEHPGLKKGHLKKAQDHKAEVKKEHKIHGQQTKADKQHMNKADHGNKGGPKGQQAMAVHPKPHKK